MIIGSYPDIHALGSPATKELFNGPVIVEEKVDGCVTPDTKILRADLRWVCAGELRLGDRLLGFEDSLKDPRFVGSFVTAVKPLRKECFHITARCGGMRTEVVATSDHPWLVGKPKIHGNNTHSCKRWVESSELSLGDHIVGLPLWEELHNWEAGYIAGFYDGEGSLVRCGAGRTLSVYQAVGPTMDGVLRILRSAGFAVRTDTRKRSENWKMVTTAIIGGKWTEILRFMGMYRPVRLLPMVEEKVWGGSPVNSCLRYVVESVEPVGVKEVTGLSTSSSTYIAAGMLCHNSQLSMGRQAPSEGGPGFFTARSRGKELIDGAVEKLFQTAYDHGKTLPLRDGWVYRGECISKPRHNSLTYGRTPKGFFAIFDITDERGEWLSPEAKKEEAERLGLECVPCYYQGDISPELIKSFIGRESFLGIAPIEGVVVKPLHYDLYGRDKKVVMGKYVSEAFKEVHKQNWSKDNPQKGDVLEEICKSLTSEARWRKAVYRLRDRGEITLDPRDIGPLMKEIQADVLKEETEWIMAKLMAWAKPHVLRKVASGFPEWYKEQLLKGEFNNG